MFTLKKKRKEVISLQVMAGLCIGCSKCILKCDREVFMMGFMGENMVAAIRYPNDCVGCGKCVRSCPAEAIELITRER